MPKRAPTHSIVDRLKAEPAARITATVGDRIARAFLCTGIEQELALDFNARLVTDLREAKVWPDRHHRGHPGAKDDGA